MGCQCPGEKYSHVRFETNFLFYFFKALKYLAEVKSLDYWHLILLKTGV